MPTIFLAIGLIVLMNWCSSQHCQPSNINIVNKGKIPASDFSPLFTMEDKTFGVLFHKCSYFCGKYQHCIGFEVCKVNEDLYRCNACCGWKKLKKYAKVIGPSDCTFYGQNAYEEFGTNIALNKYATLSSELDRYHKSSNAVDGNKICLTATSVAWTKFSTKPWFLIQLERTYRIKTVVVYARLDSYPHRTDNIVVVVNNENVNHTCGAQYPGPTGHGDAILFPCHPGCIGSNIIVQKTTSFSDVLGLCEVEVFGNL